MTRELLVHHRENEEIVARIAAKWRRSRQMSERDQRRLMIAVQADAPRSVASCL